MKGFVQGADRQQTALLPECLDDWVGERCSPHPISRSPLAAGIAFWVSLLHAGWMSRRACLPGHPLAPDHDGAGIRQGLSPDIQRRFLCFALFWHALDIIWVAIFSVVYLLGSAA
jgi:hypothetical protein